MDQVEEIKQRINIAQLVGEYVSLKKAGRHWKGLCPFHSEKTPSFIVSEEMGIFKCFGCGKGGDAIKFLEEVEGLEFREALERLAEKAGVKLKEERKDVRDERQMLLEVHSLASEYYHYLLTEHKAGKQAKDYAMGRGISEKIMKTFKLGYSLPEWDGLTRYLVGKKGYKQELLVKAGLAIANGNRVYDRFRGRLMFPLLDSGGKVVGFSGRMIPGICREDEPKYINSPETDIYHKSKMLFGLTQAKQTMRKMKRVVVVEGELDMISSYTCGVTETVAIKGSALTAEMIEILGRLVEKVVLALDADEAGEAAMKRSIQDAERRGLDIKIALLVGGKDPDEIARKSPKVWKMAVENAVEVYEFVMKKAVDKWGVTSVESIKKVSEEVVPYLAGIENSVVKEVWVKRLAEKLGVEKERVWEEVERFRTGRRDERIVEKQVEGEDSKLKRTARRLLLVLFWVDVKSRKTIAKMLEGIDIPEAEGKLVSRWLAEENEVEVKSWLAKLPEELKKLAEEVFLMDEQEVGERGAQEIAVDLGREVLKSKRKALVEELTEAEAGQKEDKAAELSEELATIDKQEQRLLGYLV